MRWVPSRDSLVVEPITRWTFGHDGQPLAFEAITRYVVSIDFVFFALTAACLFVFARRGERPSVPGHPVSTLVFIAICLFVVQATFLHDPGHSLIGLALTIAGLPVYLLWRKRRSNA